MLKYRFENFGGIVASEDPPFLAFVDRDYMRELGCGESPLWANADTSIGRLSAPTEVHFAVTNTCSAGCAHCYMDGGRPDEGELDTAALKRALDVLADLKVFHVAMGGGELFERPDWLEIAEYARSVGLVPNLTTSGRGFTPEIAQKLKIFGQVNVSVDGVGAYAEVFRGQGMFVIADRALDILIQAGVSTGINCVIGRRNFEGIPQLFEYARTKRLKEIEFLRFKPSGRGKTTYFKECTTYEQNRTLAPLLARLSAQYQITAKIDCSFVPMLCYHKPPVDTLEAIATYGCEAGNVLLGIRSNGRVSGCSFLECSGGSVFDLPQILGEEGAFQTLTTWTERAPEPCRSCAYLNICKGGCHGVAEFLTGDPDQPDPDCPFVVEYQRDKELQIVQRSQILLRTIEPVS
ncbi:radical SAM domain protein [Candidatus Vecturithrix granuli]|uniref:Radical SAM domain protein n=1 Tax=Vecturithrix granuli TaxID=1499967 RepID=A0A081BU84_VECG1|nr:radical SAM domain protein [Candidatus Vecturithrix granuli]